MSDNADPVIGWVLGELRKAANEGESMTFGRYLRAWVAFAAWKWRSGATTQLENV